MYIQEKQNGGALMGKGLVRRLTGALAAFLLTFLLLFTHGFYAWDKLLSDALCQRGGVPDSRIFIVAIDDHTLQEYGPMNR